MTPDPWLLLGVGGITLLLALGRVGVRFTATSVEPPDLRDPAGRG